MGRFKLVHDLTTPPAVAGGADWHNMHIGAKNHNRGSSSSSSSVVESDLVGTKIIESTNKIIELSTYKPAAGGQESAMANQLLVFAIVGIGGIGKTTLAQNIFADHDHKIEENFEIKMWVSVGREYSPVSVLRNVLTEAKVSHGGADTGLEAMVEGAVRGKKYFLVLDDVWDARIWDEYLRNPLRSGAAGSRVLISTRNDEVAMRMKAVRPYHRVDLLSPEDGWSLLCKKVLSPGEEEEELSGCKDIGIQIVDKCEGLPLAIKTLGGVLCGKRRRPHDWELVLENTAWSVTGLPDGINNALYLSYLDLPSHLRQCFLYCSLLPKDHLIQRQITATLWIAEGFVNANQGLSMEEMAEGYFRELVSRSLLQPDARWYDQAGCQMHDLLISLGQHLAQDESLALGRVQGLGTTITGPVKLRRLSVVTGDVEAIANFLPNPESLRSLLMFNNCTRLDQYLSNHLDHLRVLDLSGTKVTELPEDFLGKQLHLRYLNLSETSIRKIPESIGKLMNLQFLFLRRCKELHDLPKGILGLHNLRRLVLTGTMVEGMPAGIGRLQDLNVLLGFVLHQNATGGWSNLGELQHLSHLRTLSIDGLERASNGVEARAAGLVNKHRLSELHLWCTPPLAGGEQSTEDIIARIEDVFEELQPPPSLEVLQVVGYFGRKLPNWLMSVSSPLSLVLPNIRWLALKGCGYLERLPPLGQLPHLDYLKIEGATAVKTIGPEFLGVSGGGASFPRLETLNIAGMANWEEWQWDNNSQSMHCLRRLSLVVCPRLRFLPEGLLRWATALTYLCILANSKLEAVENIVSLQDLELEYCYSLERVSNLPALKRLTLVDDRMDSLPDWLSEGVHKAKPEKLVIKCNDELMKKICLLREQGKEWSKIQHINRVEIHNNDDDSVRAYYTKSPYSFTTNLNNIGNADPQEPSTSSTSGGASH